MWLQGARSVVAIVEASADVFAKVLLVVVAAKRARKAHCLRKSGATQKSKAQPAHHAEVSSRERNQIRTSCDNRICYTPVQAVRGDMQQEHMHTKHAWQSAQALKTQGKRGERKRKRPATPPPISILSRGAPPRTFFFHSSAALAGGKKKGAGRSEDVKQTSLDQEGRENDVGGDGGRTAGAAKPRA